MILAYGILLVACLALAAEAVEQRLTLLQTGELAIIPILLIVLATAAAPVVFKRRRSRYWLEVWGGLLLAAFSLLAGFSIGLFVLPIAALMFTAAMFGRATDRTA